ncbi:MAG: hypothetical protein ACRDGG_04685 [Anaerolineae bacterium]
MNAPTDVATQPAWIDAVLAMPMADSADDTTPALTAEEESDQWVSQMLFESYN